MKRNLLYIIVLAFGVVSCTPEPLDIEMPEYKDKIVVASQVIPDNVMVVALSKSFTVLSTGANAEIDSTGIEKYLIKNAIVSVEYGGKVDTLSQISDGVYVSTNTPQIINTTYHLTVKDTVDNRSVTSTSTMLPQVTLDTAYLSGYNAADSTVKMNYKFTDLSGKNYYMLNVYTRGSVENSLNPEIVFGGSSKLLITYLIDDSGREGKELSDAIEVLGVADDTLVVSVSNISKDYHNYLTKRSKAGNIFTEITNEPINYPTNVKGGLGFFNTHNPSFMVLAPE